MESTDPDSQATPVAQAVARDALRTLSLPARLEAILYLKGRPVPLAELATIAGIEREEAELALITLMADYAHRDTALEIRQEGQSFSLQLRESLGDLVQSLLPVDLSTAALRTLATIALKKRILQSELVDLRGSGAYDHIRELLAQDFIERRRQSDGRSYWLTLSEKFHRTFAVQGEALAGGRAGRPRSQQPPANVGDTAPAGVEQAPTEPAAPAEPDLWDEEKPAAASTGA
jgi:segregation and condensation protein B